jgi:hypothetical protein
VPMVGIVSVLVGFATLRRALTLCGSDMGFRLENGLRSSTCVLVGGVE